MIQRIISILTVTALLLSFAACDKQETAGGAAADPNATYTGTVSAISTQSITISTEAGEVTITLTDTTAFSRGFSMGEIPEGMGDGMLEIPSGGEAPDGMIEIPEGMGDGTIEIPNGGGIPGDMEEPPEGMDGAVLPEDQDGANNGQMDQGGMGIIDPMDGQNQDATIAVVFIGASVTIVTNENGAAASVTVSVEDWGGMQWPDNMG